MSAKQIIPDYGWSEQNSHTEAYLFGPLQQLINQLALDEAQVLDLGCGNGALVATLARWGYRAVGVDPSSSGIHVARQQFPHLIFHQASADPIELASLALPAFDVVVSTEVVEHVFSPRCWAASAFSALRPGGLLICSTLYHGYFKNCALALTGKLDAHFTALWDGGHIKFWSRRTLAVLLEEAGFEVVAFRGAGRFPLLWKSMLLAARKPLL